MGLSITRHLFSPRIYILFFNISFTSYENYKRQYLSPLYALTTRCTVSQKQKKIFFAYPEYIDIFKRFINTLYQKLPKTDFISIIHKKVEFHKLNLEKSRYM